MHSNRNEEWNRSPLAESTTDSESAQSFTLFAEVGRRQDVKTAKNDSPNIKVKEAADYLQIKVSTLYKWVHERRIPYRKHGGRLVFNRIELEKWSSANAIDIVGPLTTSISLRRTQRRNRSLKTEEGSNADRGSARKPRGA